MCKHEYIYVMACTCKHVHTYTSVCKCAIMCEAARCVEACDRNVCKEREKDPKGQSMGHITCVRQ